MATRYEGGSWRNSGLPGATNTDTPPNVQVWDRYPDIYDINATEGDIIIHKYLVGNVRKYDVYMLMSLEGDGTTLGQKALWGLIGSGTGNLDSLRGDDANIVLPNGGTIDIVGDGQNIFTRMPAANTLEIYYQGQPGEQFFTNDGGHAVPNAVTGRINLYGGSNIETSTSNINTLAFNLGIMNVFGDRDIDLTGHFHSDDYRKF